eukprot:7393654-Pyramimonas_sp.AAC.1
MTGGRLLRAPVPYYRNMVYRGEKVSIGLSEGGVNWGHWRIGNREQAGEGTPHTRKCFGQVVFMCKLIGFDARL